MQPGSLLVNVLALLGVILLLAFLIESSVEYLFGIAFTKIPKLTRHKWALMYIAMAAGIWGAMVYSFDLLYLLGQLLGVNIPSTLFGRVITGMAIGRGANYLHDLVKRFFSSTSPQELITNLATSSTVPKDNEPTSEPE